MQGEPSVALSFLSQGAINSIKTNPTREPYDVGGRLVDVGHFVLFQRKAESQRWANEFGMRPVLNRLAKVENPKHLGEDAGRCTFEH
jgi:hypothetical protein